ncbi:hypothetical protein CBOM_08072 [Ceraceosorus bombacis]|uniref:Uncharacterized protein n=1 Tax=Ceraceosorus bombacis TaxID=401625 RepID=A0A0P1BSQ5_9BASI|nr:hypothetical protein CBOM_08072 [Ceraceosorus bombacis]
MGTVEPIASLTPRLVDVQGNGETQYSPPRTGCQASHGPWAMLSEFSKLPHRAEQSASVACPAALFWDTM